MIASDHRDILNFFLNIYKAQMNASGCFGNYLSVTSPDENADTTYEFRIKRENRWFTRRMTLGNLGEDTGSKSKCYKVIYDDLLVVKIPPRPLRDFEEYIDCIRREKDISRELGPEIRCISPTVSSVLKRLPMFSADLKSDPAVFEERCIEKLRIFREYQNYLKIGNFFAFFSNLSKNSFLGRIIRDMHFGGFDLYNEIISHGDMLEHPVFSEDWYGKDNALIFYRISEVYARYDEKISALPENEDLQFLTSYQKKMWFLRHLAEKEVEKDGDGLSPDLAENINRLIRNVLDSDRELIRMYRKVVKNSIRMKNFEQNKAAMRGIVTNLLSLLAMLRDKEVAIRDLKPDNVYISGDISNNSVLLASPEEYSIGLIDFETAVSFRTDGHKRILQPMLAGTPSYATPSHLFTNELLLKSYDDLPRILHLQDWQAVNSMIFNVIVGKRLSKETGKLIPGMARIVKESLAQKMSRLQAFQNCNRIFWNRASLEFYERLETYRESLRAVIILLPEAARKMFREEALLTKVIIQKRIEFSICSQNIFRSPKSRNNLINMEPEALAASRLRWENNEKVPPTAPRIREQVIRFLQEIENLKREYGQIGELLSSLEQCRVYMPAHDIMNLMFRTVLNAMYKAEWGILADDHPQTGEPEPGSDIPDEMTMNIEKTLA